MSSDALTNHREIAERIPWIIDLHFDPRFGSPYWLDKARQLGIDARKRIRTLEELTLLGPMDATALSTRPIEDFMPQPARERRSELIVAETGGTLGRPKFAVHRTDEFHAAFVLPFVAAARRAGFPRGENWLFVGPTGPHIIGKAARACATAMGSPDPFTVDFDPRWARKLPEGSFARTRYLDHLEVQALHVLDSQSIGVLFSTPPVLDRLGTCIPREKRCRVTGIHFGGMPLTGEARERIETCFPCAVLLSGYGNTLFGLSPELNYGPETGIDYYPHGARLIVQTIEQSDEDETVRLLRPSNYGERGQVVAHRLDETQFIANMVERDTAVRIEPRNDAITDGFFLDGLRDPRPVVSQRPSVATGLY